MGLDIWFSDDIRNVLLSSRQTMLATGGDGEYRRGFEAALVTLALAFGLDVRDIGPTWQPALETGEDVRMMVTQLSAERGKR